LRDEKFLVELPVTERPFIYVLAEPMAAGVAASAAALSERIVVVGLGVVGLGAGLAAIARGQKVVAVGKHQWQLDIARRAGMHAVTESDQLPPCTTPDVVVSAGTVSALMTACRLADLGGTIHLVGMNMDDGEWRAQAGGDYVFFRKDLKLRHHYMYSIAQFREAVRLVETYENLLQEAIVGPLAFAELRGKFPARREGKRVVVAPEMSRSL
jgi:threonine dehydrogenase-like Zn-dependent dehydrogenase